MGNFNKGGGRNKFGNRSSGGGGRGGGRGFGGGRGGRGDGRSNMHRATCDDCGNSCEVPFKPTGDKPVFCSDCFSKDSGGGNRDRGRSRGRDRQMHEATCADCGNRCEVPFRPTGDKPVLCSSCFEGNPPMPSAPDSSSDKHDEILAKLDKIITLLQRTSPVKEVTVMKAEVEEEVKEEKPKKAAVNKKAPAKKKTVAKKKAPAKKKTPAKKTTKAKAKKK